MTLSTARQFANHGHKLDNDDWSAWWLAVQYSTEINSSLAALIDAGAARIEAGGRSNARQLKAAKDLFRQVLDDKTVWS